jgi:hypothetical protein
MDRTWSFGRLKEVSAKGLVGDSDRAQHQPWTGEWFGQSLAHKQALQAQVQKVRKEFQDQDL